MISIVIPTYNEEKNIDRCLKAFNKQTIPREKIEIIVVDGQSSDRTTAIAEIYADKVIQQASKGVGGARNDGVKIAKGDIIATTDADCIPHREWLEIVQKNFEKDNVVAITGFFDPIDCGGMNRYEKYVYRLLFWLSNQVLSLFSFTGYYHLCGANSAFDRDTFLEIGGYLDLPYSEDIEIYKRLKTKGKIVLEKNMKVHYSIRRINKMGLWRYLLMITKHHVATHILNIKPTDDSYAKQDYD